MQIREESVNLTSEFSKQLNYTFNWFDTNFTNIISDAFAEFWGAQADTKLISISENSNILAEREEFFVTQIRLDKELSVFIRLSKQMVKTLLERVLGSNGKAFNIEKITDLEAKILTGFNNFLYQNFENLIKKGNDIENSDNYNECNLTYFLKVNNLTLGKIVIKIPIAAIAPEPIEKNTETFDITDFKNSFTEVNLNVGHTKIRLNDLKHLETDDIVVLEYSKSSQMTLFYEDYSTNVRVVPNPAIMIDCDETYENTNNPKGDKTMESSDMYNMWDTIQVDINAEFEKVKLTLGELKQISEGLVVDIGSIYDNKIDLKVEDKIVASGELIIINDRYGVKINKIFTEEKNQASQNLEYQEEPEQYESQEIQDEPPMQAEEPQEYIQNQNDSDVNEEDFDYSDFDDDDDDL